VPQAVRTLLQRCLVKDRQRVAEISTARFILSELPSLGAPPMSRQTSPNVARWPWVLSAVAAAVVLAGVIVGVTTWALRPPPNPPAIAQFSIAPAGAAFSGLTGRVLTLSPDGRLLAYTANRRIYVRSLEELEATVIPGLEAEFPLNPEFSPDGQSLAFLSVTERLSTLKRIPISGGVATTLATFDEGAVWQSGLSWSPLGILVGGQRNGVLRVPPNGGAPERLIAVGPDELANGPQFLPDGRTVLFTVAKITDESRWDKSQVVVQSVANGTRRVLIEGSDGQYIPSGHLLFATGGTMYAAPFDVAKLAITGPAIAVIRGVRRATGGWSGLSQLTFSDTGTLAYVPGPATPNTSTRGLVLGDGRGEPTPLNVTPAAYVHPRVSPNGLVLAVGRNDGQSSDIWTYELSGKTEIKRLTFEGNNRFPVWAGDRRVAFQSTREGDKAIWWQAASGGTAERLTRPAPDEEHVPEAWSRDGTRMLFSVVKGSSVAKGSTSTLALWVYTLATKRVEPLGTVNSSESFSATFSPDGRWIAYARTDRAGGFMSPNRGVFVEPFPPTGERHQAPKRLIDFHPVWSPDGKSIFYIPGSAQPAVSVPITMEPSITFGTPADLPRNPMPGLLSVEWRGYDLLPDGRFISLAPSSGENPTGVPQVELRVFLNWFEDLKRRVPTQ
jgi:Tol biopolymer transport system component